MYDEILLHIGATKTGTSFLQYSWGYGRDGLDAGGVSYPVKDPLPKNGKPGIGNSGMLVRKAIEAEDKAEVEAEFDRLTEDADQSRLLLSSETFSGLCRAKRLRPKLERLADILHSKARRVRVLFFVRHIADHYWSQYGELVRRRRKIMPFDQFAAEFPCAFRDIADGYSAVFGKENLTVLLYDAVKDDCLGAAGAALGLPPVPPFKDRINRSMNAFEIDVAHHLNETDLPSGKLAGFLLSYSQTTPMPHDMARTQISETAIQTLQERYGEYARAFSADYLDPATPILAGSSHPPSTYQAGQFTQREEVLMQMLANCIDRMK